MLDASTKVDVRVSMVEDGSYYTPGVKVDASKCAFSELVESYETANHGRLMDVT